MRLTDRIGPFRTRLLIAAAAGVLVLVVLMTAVSFTGGIWHTLLTLISLLLALTGSLYLAARLVLPQVPAQGQSVALEARSMNSGELQVSAVMMP